MASFPIRFPPLPLTEAVCHAIISGFVLLAQGTLLIEIVGPHVAELGVQQSRGVPQLIQRQKGC